jgi:hypothetical protein
MISYLIITLVLYGYGVGESKEDESLSSIVFRSLKLAILWPILSVIAIYYMVFKKECNKITSWEGIVFLLGALAGIWIGLAAALLISIHTLMSTQEEIITLEIELRHAQKVVKEGEWWL